MEKILKYKYIFLLAFLVIVAVILRLNIISKGDIWLDEAFTGIFVRASWGDMFRMVITDFVHPPLYYSLVKLWTEALSNTSAFSIRLFSVVCGVSLVPLSYIFMNKLLRGKKKMISVLTAFIFTIDPFFINYSIEARSYALLSVLGLIAAILFLDIVREERVSKKKYLFFILTSVLLVLTHYESIPYLLSMGIGYMTIKTIHLDRKEVLNNLKKTVLLFLPAVVVLIATIGTYYAIRTYSYDLPSVGASLGWIGKAGLEKIPTTIGNFLLGVQSQQLGMPPANTLKIDFLTTGEIGILVFSALLIGIYSLLRKQDKEEVIDVKYLLSISILPILFVILLSIFGVQMYIERYMIIFGVGLILLTIYMLSKSSRNLVIGLVAIYILLVVLVNPQPTTTKYSYICGSINGENVVVDDPSVYMLVSFYCDKSSVKLYTTDPSYYDNNWLSIGRDNVIDNLRYQTGYLIKRNTDIETDPAWDSIKNNEHKSVEELTVYDLKYVNHVFFSRLLTH